MQLITDGGIGHALARHTNEKIEESREQVILTE